MTIKQSVLNTFDRVGIDETLDNENKTEEVANWITGVTAEVTPLIAECIEWVYRTQQAFDGGYAKVNLSDFDRVRYFVAEVDNNAYVTCLD